MNSDKERSADDLHARYPIPSSWTLASWILTGALLLVALAFVMGPGWRLAAFGVGVLAMPLFTLRIVAWVALRTVGKPQGWPDLPPR